jgi:hypothetical protein
MQLGIHHPCRPADKWTSSMKLEAVGKNSLKALRDDCKLGIVRENRSPKVDHLMQSN